MIPYRISFVQVVGIPTCYKSKKGNVINSELLGESSYATPLMNDVIHKLNAAVIAEGGYFDISDLSRTWKQQEDAYKNKPGLANPPGRSFHQAGNAIDVDVNNLNFKNISKDKWLEKFWDISKSLGFHPVVPRPDINLAEMWHFQIYGKDWEDASLRISGFELAKCCILDAGKWDPNEKEDKVQRMFVQAQLIRLGYYQVGAVDGIFGKNTNSVLALLKLNNTDLDTLCVLLGQSQRVLP